MATFLVVLMIIFAVCLIALIIGLIVYFYKAVIRTANASEETNELLRIIIKNQQGSSVKVQKKEEPKPEE